MKKNDMCRKEIYIPYSFEYINSLEHRKSDRILLFLKVSDSQLVIKVIYPLNYLSS